MLWTGAIGFIDDYLKIVRGKSQGLVARWKLVGQVTFGVALGIALILWPLQPDLPPTSTQLPVFKYILLVLPPPLYLLFVTVVVTGKIGRASCRERVETWCARVGLQNSRC